MNSNILGEKDGFLIRLAKAEDAAGYFEQNFCPLDQEVVRLTGCKEEFTKDEVVSFFMKSLKDDERYFFLIIAPDGSIIGESIINEIDCAGGHGAEPGPFHPGFYETGTQAAGVCGAWTQSDGVASMDGTRKGVAYGDCPGA